jgi:hypothetical protein
MGGPYKYLWPVLTQKKNIFVDYIGCVYFIIALFNYKVQFALSFDNVCAYCTTRKKWSCMSTTWSFAELWAPQLLRRKMQISSV